MKQTTNMSRVIGEIQSIGRKLNKGWFNGELDMDRVIWTVQSTPKAYGHFTPYLSYRVHDKEGERGAVEINLGGGTLDRNIELVISTMCHELTHYYNWCHGVKDCSRSGGQYHSKKFKLEAEKHGLHIEYNSQIGWSITEPTEELIEWVIENGFEDFRLGRNEFQEMIVVGTGGKSGNTPKFPKKNNSIKMICPCCGNIARVTKTTNLICGDCLQKMIEV